MKRKDWKRENDEIIGEVGRYCAMRGINVAQLATLCHMTVSTFYNRLANPGMFRLDELRRLLEVIGGKSVEEFVRKNAG